MWKYLPILALITSCATYDEQVATSKPTNDFYTSKSVEEVVNCIKVNWINYAQITDVKTVENHKIYVYGEGGGATVTPTDKGTHVVAHIKSAGWAVMPRKLAQGVESCK